MLQFLNGFAYDKCRERSLMDFLDPNKKRAHKIRLYAGYALMAIALLIATFIIVFSTYGYDIDRKSGQIIQNGLIIIDSKPQSARILINGVDKGETSNRLVLPSAKYSVELKRDGYRSWRHDVVLEGSSIEQLSYPVMFPAKLISKSIVELSSVPSMSSVSPDQHWLVMHTTGTANSFSMVDLSTAKNPVTPITLPGDAFTASAGPHSYEAIEWSGNSSHLLLKHNFGGISEFIMLDRAAPGNSLNVSKIFAPQPFTRASLRDRKSDQLYLFNEPDGNLMEADSRTKTSALLASKVTNYRAHKADTLVYTTIQPSSPSLLEVRIRQSSKDRLLRTLSTGSASLLELGDYGGHLYLAVGSVSDGKAYVYRDPTSTMDKSPTGTAQPIRLLMVSGAQYLSFAPGNRFIALQGGSSFAVFDAETGRQPRFDTRLSNAIPQKATWIDGFRLAQISNTYVYAFDFDGTNLQQLGSSFPSSGPFFDRAYSAMFTLAPVANAPDKSALVRTELKVLPTGQ